MRTLSLRLLCLLVAACDAAFLLIIILIGCILFDLDAWGIALAIIIAGVIGGLLSMGG
jgi:hypothetical protein